MSKIKFATTTGLLCFCSTAFSQEDVGIDLGIFELVPTLNANLGFNDNVSRSNDNKVDSWFSITQPKLELVNKFGHSSVRLGYQLSKGDYFSSSADDYTDHLLFASLNYELNSRNRLKAVVEYEDGHDARGSVYSIGAVNNLSSPDEYKQEEIDLIYSYGVLSAQARLDLNLNYRNLDYKLNTVDYLIRDREYRTADATFFYDIGSATELLIEARIKEIAYEYLPVGDASLDSVESSVLLGAKWESSASTTGYAKFGYQEKDFDDQARDSFSGVKWQAGIIWQPYQRATFELDTQDETRETDGEGNFIRRKEVALQWRHQWLERLNSRASVAFGNDAYEGDASDRKDEVSEVNLALIYQFKRWLSFDVGYTYSERDSNKQTIDYDQNLYTLTANVSL
jgi:hypothetical protein